MGNQLLEAIHARLPILIFEYPVYEADLKNSGVDVVSLGNQISEAEIEAMVGRGKALGDPAASNQPPEWTARRVLNNLSCKHYLIPVHCQSHYPSPRNLLAGQAHTLAGSTPSITPEPYQILWLKLK